MNYKEPLKEHYRKQNELSKEYNMRTESYFATLPHIILEDREIDQTLALELFDEEVEANIYSGHVNSQRISDIHALDFSSFNLGNGGSQYTQKIASDDISKNDFTSVKNTPGYGGGGTMEQHFGHAHPQFLKKNLKVQDASIGNVASVGMTPPGNYEGGAGVAEGESYFFFKKDKQPVGQIKGVYSRPQNQNGMERTPQKIKNPNIEYFGSGSKGEDMEFFEENNFISEVLGQRERTPPPPPELTEENFEVFKLKEETLLQSSCNTRGLRSMIRHKSRSRSLDSNSSGFNCYSVSSRKDTMDQQNSKTPGNTKNGKNHGKGNIKMSFRFDSRGYHNDLITEKKRSNTQGRSEGKELAHNLEGLKSLLEKDSSSNKNPKKLISTNETSADSAAMKKRAISQRAKKRKRLKERLKRINNKKEKLRNGEENEKLDNTDDYVKQIKQYLEKFKDVDFDDADLSDKEEDVIEGAGLPKVTESAKLTKKVKVLDTDGIDKKRKGGTKGRKKGTGRVKKTKTQSGFFSPKTPSNLYSRFKTKNLYSATSVVKNQTSSNKKSKKAMNFKRAKSPKNLKKSFMKTSLYSKTSNLKSGSSFHQTISHFSVKSQYKSIALNSNNSKDLSKASFNGHNPDSELKAGAFYKDSFKKIEGKMKRRKNKLVKNLLAKSIGSKTSFQSDHLKNFGKEMNHRIEEESCDVSREYLGMLKVQKKSLVNAIRSVSNKHKINGRRANKSNRKHKIGFRKAHSIDVSARKLRKATEKNKKKIVDRTNKTRKENVRSASKDRKHIKSPRPSQIGKMFSVKKKLNEDLEKHSTAQRSPGNMRNTITVSQDTVNSIRRPQTEKTRKKKKLKKSKINENSEKGKYSYNKFQTSIDEFQQSESIQSLKMTKSRRVKDKSGKNMKSMKQLFGKDREMSNERLFEKAGVYTEGCRKLNVYEQRSEIIRRKLFHRSKNL